MGIPCGDDVVLIQHGKEPGEPSVITVNCPDKAGLGCDLSRIILEFGFSIARAGIFVLVARFNDSFFSLFVCSVGNYSSRESSVA